MVILELCKAITIKIQYKPGAILSGAFTTYIYMLPICILRWTLSSETDCPWLVLYAERVIGERERDIPTDKDNTL
jgi:hypothetical protein